MLYQAQQHFQKDDYGRCCQVIEDYLLAHPENRHGRFFLLLGNGYFRLKDFPKAQAAYRQGLDLQPRDPMFHLNLALALENGGQTRQAADQYLRAYEVRNEPDPQLLYRAAALLAGTKQYRRAAKVLGQLGRRHPPVRTEWLELLLYVDFELQDYGAAVRVTEQLLARAPDKVVYWQQLAQLRLQRKQYLGAAAAYEVVYRSRPPSRKELEQLAELYLYVNLPLRAAQALERIAPDDRSRGDLQRLAGLYRRGGLAEEAERCLTRLMERWPDAEACQLKAELLYERGAYEQALQLLDNACESYPEHARLYLQRGYAAWQLQDWERAARSFVAAQRFKSTRSRATAALEIIEVLRSQAAPSPPSTLTSAPLTAGIN
jgi:tetratricopeptide (TPR) repeat protein